MSRKKIISLLVALSLVIMIVGLSACTGSSNESPKKDDTPSNESNPPDDGKEGSSDESTEVVEIKYFGWNDEKSYIDPVIEAFNSQNTGVKVVSDYMVPDDYLVKVLTMISSGNANFDVYSVNQSDKVHQYQQVGGLVDLTSLIEKSSLDISKFGPSMQTLKIDEKYYAVPYRSTSWAIYYNKDIFDDANIPYPEELTWEEYATLAKQLTSGSGQDKIWGGFIADWINESMIAIQKDSNLLDDDLSAVVEWLEYLDRVYNIDKSHMGFAEMKSTKVDWIKIFESGKVGMLLNGEWTISMLNADKADGQHDINWDVAPLPVENKGDTLKSPGGISTFLGIYNDSKHVDEAFEFIEFFCGEEGAKILADKGVLTAYITDDIKEAFKTSSGVMGADALLRAETYPDSLPIPQMAAILKAYAEEKELYLTGQQTIDKFMDNFTKKRTDAFND